MVTGASNFETIKEKESINDEHQLGNSVSQKATTNLTLKSVNPLITVSSPTGKENVPVDKVKHQVTHLPTSEPIGIVYIYIVYKFPLFITESDKEAPQSRRPAVTINSSCRKSALSESLPISSIGMFNKHIYMTANLLNDDLLGTNIEILNHIAVDFTKLIDVDTLLPYLLKHQMLTDEEVDSCRSSLTNQTEKTKKLLQLLKQKGKKSLQKLLCCLTNETTHLGHRNVATKLKDAMKLFNFNGKLVCPVCKKPILNKGK